MQEEEQEERECHERAQRRAREQADSDRYYEQQQEQQPEPEYPEPPLPNPNSGHPFSFACGEDNLPLGMRSCSLCGHGLDFHGGEVADTPEDKRLFAKLSRPDDVVSSMREMNDGSFVVQHSQGDGTGTQDIQI